jgi:outer membrane protein, multidrug efflux system
MTRRPILWLCAVGFLAAGCTMLGPDYKRPEVKAPPVHRGAPAEVPAPSATSLGELGWWTIFQDPELQKLVRAALVENSDLRITVTRILQAQAQLTVVRSQQYPTVNASVGAPYNLYFGGERPAPREQFNPQGGIDVAWELDFWGRLRRSSEAAQAELLASEEFRNAVVTTLVAEVAQAYFDLRSLDQSLEISKRTLASRQQSLELVQARMEGGVAAMIDVRQAESLVYTAATAIPEAERRIERTENALNVLLGRPPGAVKRGRPLTQQVTFPEVPIGVPSQLLERRPDIRQAEQQLIAANAQIGAAMARLYPQVFISGFAGAGGAVINGQAFGPFGILNALPSITLPIFNMGRYRAEVEQAEARTQEALERYRQTIQQAFREVADGLVEQRKRRETRLQQEGLARTSLDLSEVAKMRYEGGVSSYLEVQDAERQLFSAELDLATAQRDELAAIVQLYKALGGGWQSEETPAKP